MEFRIFAQPVKEQLDYEIELIYQTGEVGRRNHFSHPHLGAVGDSFGTDWPLRFVCLFDYSSGNPNPSKHFNFLFANDAQNTNQPEFFESSFHPISFTCWILLANRPPTVKLMEPHRTFGMAVVLLWEAVCSTRPVERVPSSVIHSIRRDIWAPQAGYFRHMTFDMDFPSFSKASILIESHKAGGTAAVNDVYTMATLTF